MAFEQLKCFNAIFFDDRIQYFLMGFIGVMRGFVICDIATAQISVNCIDGLLQNIFRIKNVLDAVIALVGLGMVLAIVLVFALSLRLRQREIETIFKLGCRRMTIARLIAAEIFLIVGTSGILCSGLMFIVNIFANSVSLT